MFKQICNFILIILSLPMIILTLPLSLFSFLEKNMTNYEYLFAFGAHLVAIFPGFVGNLVRKVYYLLSLEYFHHTACISYGSFFSKRAAKIDAFSGIGAYCVIGLVDIKKNVRIASKVSITSGLHQHGSSANIENKKEGDGKNRRIFIGKDSWIGEGAIIGASVGENCIVGLGAVVINDIPDNNMAMGNPARLLPTVKK